MGRKLNEWLKKYQILILIIKDGGKQYGQMEKCMKAGIYRIKKKDLASLHGQMAGNILGNGKMGNRREKASILMSLDRWRRGVGVMVNLFNDIFCILIKFKTMKNCCINSCDLNKLK